MRTTRNNRQSDCRRTTNRKNFLRLERLEDRLALATASPVAVNDFYNDLVDQPLAISAPGILANDTAESGASLSAGLFSGPSHGTLNMAEDGSFQYTPEAGYMGLDSFLYFASDGASDSQLAAVTIRVGEGGDPPVAADDSYSIDEDGVLSVALSDGVLANDTTSDGETPVASLVSGPANGTLSLGADGSITYLPSANFNGVDSFTYKATDAAGDSNIATVTITVNPVNDKPAAANDGYAVNEDTALTVDAASGLLANDVDIDGDTLTPTVTSQPLHGTVTVNPDGSFSYTPEANYNGLDGFSYLVSDGQATSDVASATITIIPVNDLPVGVNDEFTTAEDTPLSIVAPGVLANDTDVDADALSSILVNPPQHGTVTLGPDGGLLYTPEANFNGVDGFSYLANDGSADSEATAVTINVTPVNDAPTAANDELTTAEDTPLTVPAPGILGNDADLDGDPLTSTIVTQPASGTVTLNADDSLTYTPNANFNGVDGFTYTVSDGTATSEAASVTINVTPVNDGPVGTADAYHTEEDTPLTVDAASGVLANDSDPDGDPLTATLVAGPANGSLTLNADGSFNYTPNANFNGSDSFTYQASDGMLASDPVTVAIDVCPVNDAPTTADDAYSLDQGTTLTVDALTGVLANDSDLDGDPLSASVVTGPANGSLSLNADGSFSYTPSANFSGTDSFTYAAGDGTTMTPATVTLTVNPVAQAPVAAIDNYSTGEDVPLTIGTDLGVLANDLNPDGGSLTAEVVTPPAHGALTLNPDGSFSFTPAANYNGSDSFTYKAVSNGQEMVSSANIVIEPLNDAPVAANDEFAIDSSGAQSATANNVLANDSDIDGDSLTAALVSGPEHGSLSLNADGTFNYTPTQGFTGDDAFRYQLFDGKANSNVATVTLHVADGTSETPAPPPVASDDAFTVQAGSTLTIDAPGLLANDAGEAGQPLTAAAINTPAHGTLTLNADGSFSYTPEASFTGTDTFTYQATDGTVASNTATVTITVEAAQNQRPEAVNDVFNMASGTALNVPAAMGLLTNDTDPEGSALTASLFSPPLHGSVTLAPDGSFSYTPTAGYVGLDAFLYRVSDSELWSALAAVTIHVTPADNGPDQAPVPTPGPCDGMDSGSFAMAADAIFGNDGRIS
jgi:VCBS repeat-containing protein